VAAVVACAHGDQVICDAANYTRVKVTGHADGRLLLSQDDGSITSVPLGRVQRMVIDSVGGMADLNDAERYLAENDLEKAIVRYERALRMGTEFWPTIIRVRLLQACDRAGKFERAVDHFVAVAQEAPSAAAAMIPASIPQGRRPETKGLVRRLTSEANRSTRDEQRVLLELLRYAVLLEGEDPEAARWTREVAATAIPAGIGTAAVYRIRVAACAELLAAGALEDLLDSVNQAAADCPLEVLPELLFLKGRALLERASNREDLLIAGTTLMRVAIHFPDDARAPEALFWAAKVHERLDRRGKAVQLLNECLNHARVSQSVRQRAEADLLRLEQEPSE